jgi:hypothetical protein
VPDYGLMQGLAEGLKSGLDSYNSAKRYNEDKAQKDKLYNLQLLKAGYQDTPSGLVPRQDKSAYGETLRGAAVQNYKLANPNATDQDLEKAIPHGLLPEQYEKFGSMVKPALTYQGQATRAKSYEDIGHERNKIAGAGLDLRQSNQALSFGKGVQKDPIILAAEQQNNSIQKGLTTLESGKLTPQAWHEVQIDLANVISNGKSAAQGTIARTAADTLESKKAEIEQYISSHPQDVGSPEMKAYVGQRFRDIQKVNQQIRSGRTKELTDTSAAAAPNNKYMSSVNQGLMQQNPPPAAPQMSPEDQQAVQWAQGNPKDPRAQQILKMHGM